MNIPLPTTLDINEVKGNKATITIEPCFPGYGVTLGNSLRRVLLSSLEGAAITSIKVNGVQHEFSSLPDVKEDFVEIILNIKKIRLKVFSDEPVILNLNASGQKKVTAKDIEKNAQAEVVNPDEFIATLTSKDANLNIELVAEKGRGYVTVDDRAKEKVEVGAIMIDSLFTPVITVGFEIDNIRVGDRTDYEKLVLKIETDGTITPKDAINHSSQVLFDHFQTILENTGSKPKKEKKVEDKEPASTAKRGEQGTNDKVQEEKIKEEKAEVKEKKVEVEDKPKKKRGRPKKTDV